MKKKRGTRWIRALAWGGAAAAALGCFLVGLNRLDNGQTDVGIQQLETALRRAAVTCYATEGVYPQNLKELTEHSGIQINEEQYTVFYEVVAQNLMPEITVVEN